MLSWKLWSGLSGLKRGHSGISRMPWLLKDPGSTTEIPNLSLQIKAVIRKIQALDKKMHTLDNFSGFHDFFY
jgi:hypothetical protein